MEGEQRYPIPLDAGLDINAGDMLVSVEEPKFSYNRQRKIGDAMPSSVRYEDFGWFAGWLKHNFVRDNLHKAAIDLKNATVTITPHTIDGLYTYWEVEITVWTDETQTNFKQKTKFTYLPSSTDMVCLLGECTKVVRDGDVVTFTGTTNTDDNVSFAFNYKSREFSDVKITAKMPDGTVVDTKSSYTWSFKDDEGVDQFNVTQASNEQAAVVIIPGQAAQFQDVLLPYTFNIQGKNEHWWGDTFYDVENGKNSNVKVSDKHSEVTITGLANSKYDENGAKTIKVQDRSIATITWAFLFQDYWTKIEVLSANALAQYLGDSSAASNVLNQTDCSVHKLEDPFGGKKFVIQYGVPVWLRHKIVFSAEKSVQGSLLGSSGTPKPLQNNVWTVAFAFQETAYNKNNGLYTEEPGVDENNKPITFVSSSCAGKIDIDWEKELAITVKSPFINKDQYEEDKEPKVCVGGVASYDPTKDLLKTSIKEYNEFMAKYNVTSGTDVHYKRNVASLYDGTLRIPGAYEKEKLAHFDRALPRWHTFTARVKKQDTKGRFQGEDGYDSETGVATLRTKNFMPVRYIARKYLTDSDKRYDPRPRLADSTNPNKKYWGTPRTAMGTLSHTLLDLDIVWHSEDGVQKAQEPIRYKTLPRAWACDLVVKLEEVQKDIDRRALNQEDAATIDTLFYEYKIGKQTYIVLEEYVLGGIAPNGASTNKNFNPIILNPEISVGDKGEIDGTGDVFRLLDTTKPYDPRPYTNSNDDSDDDFKANCSTDNTTFSQPYVENKGAYTATYAAYLKNEYDVTEFFPYNATVVWVETYAMQARDFMYTSPFFHDVYPSLTPPTASEAIESHVTLTKYLERYYGRELIPHARIYTSLSSFEVVPIDVPIAQGSSEKKSFDYVQLSTNIVENKEQSIIKDENGKPAPLMQLTSDDSFVRLVKPTYDPKQVVHNVSDLEGVTIQWAIGAGNVAQDTVWKQVQIIRKLRHKFLWWKVRTETTRYGWHDDGPKVIQKPGDMSFQDVPLQKKVQDNIKLILDYLNAYVKADGYAGDADVIRLSIVLALLSLLPDLRKYSMSQVKAIRDGVQNLYDMFVPCMSNDTDADGAKYKEIVMAGEDGKELPEAEALSKYSDADYVHIPNAAFGSKKTEIGESSGEHSISGKDAMDILSEIVQAGALFGYSQSTDWYKETRTVRHIKNTNVTVIFVSCSVGSQKNATPLKNKHLFRTGIGLDQRLLGDVSRSPLLAASAIARFNNNLGTLNGIPGFQGGSCVPLQSSDEKESSLMQYDTNTRKASLIIPQCVKAYSFTEFDVSDSVKVLSNRKVPAKGTSYINVPHTDMPWDFTALEPANQYYNYIRLADLSPNVTWQYDRTNDSIIKVTVSFVKSVDNESGTPLYVANVPVTEDVQSIDNDGKMVQSKKINSVYPAWMLDSNRFAYASRTMAPLSISAENGIGFQVTIDIGLSRKIASIDGTLLIKNMTPFNAHLFDDITLPKYRLPEITEQNYKELIIDEKKQEIILNLDKAHKLITFTYDNFMRAISRVDGIEITEGSANSLFNCDKTSFKDTLDSTQTISVSGTRYYNTGDTVILQKVKLNPVIVPDPKPDDWWLEPLNKIAPNLSVLYQDGNVIKFNDFDVSGDDKPDNVYGAYNYVSHELSNASYILQRNVELFDDEKKQKVFLSMINGFIARFNTQGIREYTKDVSYVGEMSYENGEVHEEETNELKIKITTS